MTDTESKLDINFFVLSIWNLFNLHIYVFVNTLNDFLSYENHN